MIKPEWIPSAYSQPDKGQPKAVINTTEVKPALYNYKDIFIKRGHKKRTKNKKELHF